MVRLREIRVDLCWLSPARLRQQVPGDRWLFQVRAGLRRPPVTPFDPAQPYFWNPYFYASVLGFMVGGGALVVYDPERGER